MHVAVDVCSVLWERINAWLCTLVVSFCSCVVLEPCCLSRCASMHVAVDVCSVLWERINAWLCTLVVSFCSCAVLECVNFVRTC